MLSRQQYKLSNLVWKKKKCRQLFFFKYLLQPLHNI